MLQLRHQPSDLEQNFTKGAPHGLSWAWAETITIWFERGGGGLDLLQVGEAGPVWYAPRGGRVVEPNGIHKEVRKQNCVPKEMAPLIFFFYS